MESNQKKTKTKTRKPEIESESTAPSPREAEDSHAETPGGVYPEDSHAETGDAPAEKEGMEESHVSPPQTYPSDLVPVHSDQPATKDMLGRKTFAESLGRRLKRIWLENKDSGFDGAFMVHLHAPWGAGKTSLLNLLEEELKKDKPDDDASPWVVVRFNAWRHQHVQPPWWSLIDRVFRRACGQIASQPAGLLRVLKLCIHESRWRLFSGRTHYLLAIALFLWIVAILIWWAWPTGGETTLSGLSTTAKSISIHTEAAPIGAGLAVG